MEADDFVNFCHDFVGSNANKQEWEEITDYFQDKCPPLATAVRVHREYNRMKPYNSRCFEPYNECFHNLPHREGVVVDAPGAVTEFLRCLRDSEYFSADFHGTACFDDSRGRIGLATFVFKRGIYHVLPALFPDLIPSIVKAFRSTPRMMMVFRWDNDKKNFLKSFNGYHPPEVVDTLTVAREKGLPTRYDDICVSVTGGVICRRAAFFGDTAFPSSEALRHCASRACLPFEFIVKHRNLREKRDVVSAETCDRERAPGRLSVFERLAPPPSESVQVSDIVPAVETARVSVSARAPKRGHERERAREQSRERGNERARERSRGRGSERARGRSRERENERRRERDRRSWSREKKKKRDDDRDRRRRSHSRDRDRKRHYR